MQLTRATGRTRELVKAVHLPIPEDFAIPACQSCGDEVWSPEISEALDTILSKQLGEAGRGHIDELTDRVDVTQAQVGQGRERAGSQEQSGEANVAAVHKS